MALLFIDSFDHLASADLTEKGWSGGAISATNGRRSSASFRCTAATGFTRVVSAGSSTVVVGVAMRASTLALHMLLNISEGGAAHIGLRLNADGSLSACRMNAASWATTPNVAAVLGSSAAGVVPANTFVFLEVQTTIHDTTGSVAVRVNGTSVITLTNQDTRNGGTGVVTLIALGANGGGSTIDFDDLYVLDDTGTPNSFLGDSRVDYCTSTAAGATTGWTPSTGANWQNVDDAAPNDDTDFNSAASTGLTDTFLTQDAPIPGATIYGVQTILNAKKSDTGACSLAPVIRHSGTDNVGTAGAQGLAYAYLTQVFATNPGTGTAWTTTTFNAAEFGYARTV